MNNNHTPACELFTESDSFSNRKLMSASLLSLDRFTLPEYQHVESALKESERRFRNLLETVDLIAIILDERGMLTFCNPYFTRLTGWRQEELLGRNWHESFVSIEPAVVEQNLRRP